MPATYTVVKQGDGRFVAQDAGGAQVGEATWSRTLFGLPCKSGHRFVHLAVAPAHRGQGAGGALYQAVERDAARHGAEVIECSVAPDDEAALAFATRRGFRVDYRMCESELDLATFDPAPWAGVIKEAEARGFHFTSLLQVRGPQEQRDFLKNLYELDRHTSYDVPQWSGVMPSFEEYCEQLEAYDQAGSFLAWHDDELVGLSFVEPDGYISYMGVARVWQRQGVALALKLLTIQWAREHGLTHLRSTNNAASESILSLNRRLGYTLRPGPIYLVKDVVAPVTVLKELVKSVGTLAIFVVIYAWLRDWTYGIGVGVIFLVHELGHVVAGGLRGYLLSSPTFIPLIGAFVVWKQEPLSAYDRAFVSAGGPVAGLLASAATWGLGAAFHMPALTAIAYTGFAIHVFNLIPMPPLDGGHIVGAVSRWIWAAAIPAMLVFTLWQDLGFMAGALLPTAYRMVTEKGREDYYRLPLRLRGQALGVYTLLVIASIAGTWATSLQVAGRFQLPWYKPDRGDNLVFALGFAGLIGLGYFAYLLIKRLGWLDPIPLGKDQPEEPAHAADER